MTPYLVINSLITQLLRGIDGFKLDLGKNMLSERNQLQMKDELQQRSLIVRDAFVHRVGSLGTIPVYVDEGYRNWRMTLCLDAKRYVDRTPTREELYDIGAYVEGMLVELFAPEEEKKKDNEDEKGR